MSVHINWLSPVKKIFAKILTLVLRIWTGTLRIHLDRDSVLLLKQYRQTAKICALWHNRLFIASHLFRKYFRETPMYGLISPSRDGAWLTEIYRNLGIRSVRGSAQRGGQHALWEMIHAINKGASVTITPDGPRGPLYTAKSGIATLAKETHVPILLAGIKIHRAWRFRSWDHFYLPKPFSKISVTFHVISAEEYEKKTREQLLQEIQAKLFQINSKGEKLSHGSLMHS